MSQQTNLNVSPYFDDFDANNDYYKVLFKPGYPIQARELTTSQTILQNQIEKFGQHFFKDGAKVIPGNTIYTDLYHAVEIDNTYLGVPVSSYADQLINTKITGASSGVTAIVTNVLLPQFSERGNLTLYVNYLQASTLNNFNETFIDGELLTCSSNIINTLLGTSSIAIGEPFASTISRNATSVGSAFSINEGVYFIRGYFLNVKKETLILDQYTNRPSYRIGFFVNEEIITSDIDENLNDNSQGFNNYSAPGADRLKISLSLFKKSLDDFNDDNFVELATVRNGILISKNNRYTQYNLISEELARRTYDESGDYYIKPFDIFIKESLNDRLGNNGVFVDGQLTDGGSVASDNLALYQVSPGKAYVRGYEVDIISSTFIDVPKPRTTKTLKEQTIIYNTGPTIALNRVHGSPKIGIGNTYVLSLRDSRVGVSSITAPGKEIGVARVYDFKLESGSYNDSSLSKLNQWNISLFDIQTVTEITVNEPTTLQTPTFVKGKNSGATGFLKDSISSNKLLSLYQTDGNFLTNETLIFDGRESNRISVAVTSYGFSDVKSVYGMVGAGNTFSADVIQSPKYNVGVAKISANSGGISTITSTNPLFPGNVVKKGDLLSYTDPRFVDPVFVEVKEKSNFSISVSGVTTVANIVEGSLPSGSDLSVSDLQVLHTKLESSSDNTLYTKLPNTNISNVDLTSSSLVIRKTYDTGISISSGQLTTITADQGESFLPFDEERYLLIRSNGSTEKLTSDKVKITNGNVLDIKNLESGNDSNPTLIATLKKENPKEKIKKKNRVKSLVVNKSIIEGSGSGQNTLDNGLTYGNYPYGTRVEDEIISINEPDVIEIHAIFESRGISEAYAPSMSLSSISGQNAKTSDLIIGEQLIGEISGAVAIIIDRKTDSEIYYVSKNNVSFVLGETLLFQESKIRASLSLLSSTSNDVTSNYTFNNGQKSTIYDYGTIIRKNSFSPPSKQLKIYFSCAYYDSSDDGDITTSNSYVLHDYTKEIAVVNGSRVTDLIDIRPRVSSYAVTVDSRSPLEFYGRLFNSSGNSARNTLASDENITLSYSFYLGRIDRIYLNKSGKLQLKFGSPSENPQKPIAIDDSLEIASINLPPYLYNISDAYIEFATHKRYRMNDIKNLEDRINTLEYYSSLSLLESKAENLIIQDSQGLNRFKSGFIVDNFTIRGDKSQSVQDNTYTVKNSVDVENQELRPLDKSSSITLTPFLNETDNTIDGINVSLSEGKLITLNYTDVEWKKQILATRTESVTPYILNYWTGKLELTPFLDTWVGTKREDGIKTVIDGSYELAKKVFNIGEDGFSPVTYNEYKDIWVGKETIDPVKKGVSYTSSETEGYITTIKTLQDYTNQTLETGYKERTGSRIQLTSTESQIFSADRVIRRDNSLVMRSRNIEFLAKNIKPLSEVVPIFDNVVVSQYCVPKLLEIKMRSGKFSIGEDVFSTEVDTSDSSAFKPKIKFKLCSPNHKAGPIGDSSGPPSEIYTLSPYNQEEIIQSDYSNSSTLLNIDTDSLSDITKGLYGGHVNIGMVLVGQTSGAVAEITSIRFISDHTSTLIGSFFIPNTSVLSFSTGTKTFTLLGNSTRADQNFVSSGSIEIVQENIISVKNPTILTQEIAPERGEDIRRTIDGDTFTKTISSSTINNTPIPISDPPRYQTYLPTQSDFLPPPSRPAEATPVAPTPVAPTPFVINRDAPTLAQFGQSALREASKSVGYSGPNILAQVAKDAGVKIERNDSGNIIPSVANKLVAEIKSQGGTVNGRPICNRKDPLAQSFFVEDENGVFLTKCDIFFETIPTTSEIPVTLDIRTMIGGYPSSVIVPYSEVSLNPKDIQGKTSSDGSLATTFRFKSPVYLEGGKEYCICLVSESPDYFVFIARVLENDKITGSFLSQQSNFDSLFKSQNQSTWVPSPLEDLKYKLYRADFVQSGIVNFYNPKLNNNNQYSPRLRPDSLNLYSKNIRISLGSSLSDPNLVLGNTIKQLNTTGRGNYVGSAGSAHGTLTTINSGIGYTPSSGSFTFSNVSLETITGSGKNATANITIVDGKVIGSGVTIVNGGSGYVVGDILGISSIGSLGVGLNARFSVGIITSVNQLILDNVQGEFTTSGSDVIQYVNNSGITTTLNYPSQVSISEITTISDGLHIKVNHDNHGMHSDQNYVTIFGVASDISPTKLTSAYLSDSTSSISVENSSEFGTFEGVGIATTNPGYLLIGNEVISYTSVSANSIGGEITRDITSVGNVPDQYDIGTPVYKYEFGGISLRRINKTHILSDVDNNIISNPISIDSYHIKIDTTVNGINRGTGTDLSKLFINQSKSGGGSNITATKNIAFERVYPNVINTTVNGTSISGEIVTITGKSISGNEISFVSNGYEIVAINQENYLDTPRIVCSEINEQLNLSNQKSFSLRLYLSTTDSKISPTIESTSVSAILSTNKVNDAIIDYKTDNRVNSILEDPTAFQYVTKEIALETSASSIKIILDAHTNPYANIRAFYAIGDNPNFSPIFVPFPGYLNLNEKKEIINFENNDGLSDSYIVPSTLGKKFVDYKEHTFTIDELPSFRYFRVKLIGTSTNQVYPPRIKNLRIISLA